MLRKRERSRAIVIDVFVSNFLSPKVKKSEVTAATHHMGIKRKVANSAWSEKRRNSTVGLSTSEYSTVQYSTVQ